MVSNYFVNTGNFKKLSGQHHKYIFHKHFKCAPANKHCAELLPNEEVYNCFNFVLRKHFNCKIIPKLYECLTPLNDLLKMFEQLRKVADN